MKIKFIVLCLVVSIFMIVGYARFIEPMMLTTRSFDMYTDKLMKPITIVFFTDTHFGRDYDVANVKHIVEKINKEEADIVLFGGDLFDNFARDRSDIDLEYLQIEMSNIKASIGKYAVRGNHDYGGGAVRIYKQFMQESGFMLLDNESVEFSDYGIKLIGYDDYLMGWTDPSLYQIEGNDLNIILAHEPIVARRIENDSENFLLSGHTHGGQVSIPFLTKKLLPEGSEGFIKGFYNQEEIGTTTSLQMYTSSGIGMTRYPFRFLNVPEIVKIKLYNANECTSLLIDRC